MATGTVELSQMSGWSQVEMIMEMRLCLLLAVYT